jgi:hypothetical protein
MGTVKSMLKVEEEVEEIEEEEEEEPENIPKSKPILIKNKSTTSVIEMMENNFNISPKIIPAAPTRASSTTATVTPWNPSLTEEEHETENSE